MDELGEMIQSGSYLGNGTTQDIFCGRTPKYIKIIRVDRKYIVTKWETESATQGQIALGTSKIYRWVEAADHDLVFTETGFTVDSSVIVNENGIEYLWEVKF